MLSIWYSVLENIVPTSSMQACTDTIERDVEMELADEYRKLEEEVARKQAKMIREFERKQKLVEERRARQEERRKMEEERVAVEEAKCRLEEEKQREEDARRIEEEAKTAQIETPRAEAPIQVKKVAEQVIKGTESFEELKRVIRELEEVNNIGEDEVEEEAGSTTRKAPELKKTRLPMIEAGSHLRAVSGKVSRKYVC
jgi:hypothetical protein